MDPGPPARYASAEGAAAYRDKYERSWLRRRSSLRERRLVVGLLDAAGAHGEVLDVPCAAGRMVPALLSRATRVVAMDLSPAMVAVATQALSREMAEGRVVVSVGSAEALPFPDRSFDAVVCWRLLHHLHDRAARVRVLAEASRVARTAVVLSIADPSTWKARLDGLRGHRRRCAQSTLADLASEAREAGLAVVASRALSPAFSWLRGIALRRA